VKGDARGGSAPRGAKSALTSLDCDSEISATLREALEKRRDEIVELWMARTVEGFPDFTSRFFLGEKDRFRNPVGHALKESLPILVDQAIGDMNESRIVTALDSIVKIRAVQDFSAAQAVVFIFFLKHVLQDILPKEIQQNGNGLAPIESRIDGMALLAFDIFLQCREKMQELKVNEIRRRMFLLERMQSGTDRSAPEAGPENRVP
jgi:hypothetical protein